MKYMKRNLKPLLSFILGAIIFTGIGIVYALNIYANDISYSNSNVNDTIEDLYSKVDNPLTLYKSGFITGTSLKNGKRKKETLTPGRYIVILSENNPNTITNGYGNVEIELNNNKNSYNTIKLEKSGASNERSGSSIVGTFELNIVEEEEVTFVGKDTYDSDVDGTILIYQVMKY